MTFTRKKLCSDYDTFLMNTYDFFHGLKGGGRVEDFGGHMVLRENGVGISRANRV